MNYILSEHEKAMAGFGRIVAKYTATEELVKKANRILVAAKDFGKSREDIEKYRDKWIHYIPFDAPFAQALTGLYK